jgi:hypothetical protein
MLHLFSLNFPTVEMLALVQEGVVFYVTNVGMQ